MWPFRSDPTIELGKLRDCYNYIIVGAGSAGCVLASRLSENPAVSVLLLERGRSALDWASHVPLLTSNFQSDGSRSKTFLSTPQPALDNKPAELVVGNAFGGSSKINGMIYTRPLPAQLNEWGRKGWSYDELYPYFLKSEGAVNRTKAEKFHNLEGEWKNRSISPQCVFASAHNTIRAAKDLDFPYISDINSPYEPIYGIAKLDHNIDSSGRRADTALALLPVSLLKDRRDRLHVCPNVLVTRIEFETEGETLVAKGVVIEPTDPNGRTRRKIVSAAKEIILCAGALATPQILMLSGVGPRQHLEDMGIEVKKGLPGVGSNLQDHLGLVTTFNVPLKDSLAVMQKSPLTAMRELVKYLLFGTGIFLCPVHELSLFVNTEFLSEDCKNLVKDPTSIDRNDPKYVPDIELMTIAYADGEAERAAEVDGGFGLFPSPVRPYSRGTVRLKSQDSRENPLVDPNFLADPRDRTAAHEGLKLCLKLKERLAANGYPIKDISVPSGTSPGELDKHIEKFGRSFYHYTSTCRMAPEDDTLPGVVDDELRVHGVERLRIADASVFPGILATHLQPTVVAIAEKCSDMLKRDAEKGVEARI